MEKKRKENKKQKEKQTKKAKKNRLTPARGWEGEVMQACGRHSACDQLVTGLRLVGFTTSGL